MNRRDFLKWVNRAALAASGVVVIGPILAYFFPAKLEEMPSEPVPVGPAADLPTGGSKTVPYGRWPALVINTDGGLKAYSAVCTHFGCVVKWNADTGQIDCPCHEGYFSPEDGSVISGPPPKPLQALPVSVEAGQITLGVLES